MIRTLGEWLLIGGGAQDALDDVELHSAIHGFLSQRDAPPTTSQEEDVTLLWTELENDRASLLQSFTAQTKRPQTRHVPVRGSVSGTAAHDFGVRPPVVDETTPEDLVNNLDAMAAAAFRNVIQEVRDYFNAWNLAKSCTGSLCYR